VRKILWGEKKNEKRSYRRSTEARARKKQGRWKVVLHKGPVGQKTKGFGTDKMNIKDSLGSEGREQTPQKSPLGRQIFNKGGKFREQKRRRSMGEDRRKPGGSTGPKRGVCKGAAWNLPSGPTLGAIS